jgi:hypothetical protein
VAKGSGQGTGVKRACRALELMLLMGRKENSFWLWFGLALDVREKV